MNSRNTLLAGAIFGALSVAFGAFGAHALKQVLMQTGRLETYEMAVRYQFYHAFALLLIGILQQTNLHMFLKASATLIGVGVLLFSGSLFLMCFTSIYAIALITPIGGILLILGWLFLALGIFKTTE